MAYVALGALLRTARLGKQLEQQDVARSLRVRQQAVSAWERGATRPREAQLPELCGLLDLQLDEVRVAGEYVAPTWTPSKTRLLVLPFERLSAEAFEAFCRDLFSALYPLRGSTRNGASGFKQFGVDVIVDGEGERIGVQCKRHLVFGPTDVSAAVQEVLPDAAITRGVIALSRPTATPAARLAMARYSDWTLWDGEDLSARVRELPKDRQLALVDSYFEGLRLPFLGVEDPSPWLESKDFDPALAGRLGYDRSFSLTGRGVELSALRSLIVDVEPIIFLTGRNGIGKSRLLLEMADLESDRVVRFAARTSISPDAFEALPPGAPVIVIDDAASSDLDLAYIAGGIRSRRPDSTIVVAAEPSSFGRLCRTLEISPDDAERVTVQVSDLELKDAEALARLALGADASDENAEQLSRVGYDCPLLILLGAHLIRQGKIRASEVGSSDSLRREIFSRFIDGFVQGHDGAARKSVLEAVAATQPSRLNDPEVLETLASLSGMPSRRVLEIVDDLEETGALLRRGESVRIVPDLLGEAVLERDLLTRAGRDTRFAEEIARSARGDALTNAMQNVSLIDWRRNLGGDGALATTLWSSVTAVATELPNSARISLTQGVTGVAAVHSDRALQFAAALIASPAADEPDPIGSLFGDDRVISHQDCERALAPLIRNACYDPRSLREGMRLLWDIGLQDRRAENQNPAHGMRLLREVGEYHPDRPISYTCEFLDEVENWLQTESDGARRAALLGLMKPLLADRVTTTRSKSMTLTISHHAVDSNATLPVRMRVIEIAGKFLLDGPEVAGAATELLEQALRFGSKEEPVTVDFAAATERLTRQLADPAAPAGMRLEAYRALGWHATYGSGSRRALARSARKRMFRDADLRVLRLMRTGWALRDFEDEDEEVRPDQLYERSLAAGAKLVEEVLAEYLTLTADDVLGRILRHMREEGVGTRNFRTPELLLSRLYEASPEVLASALLLSEWTDVPSRLVKQLALIELFVRGDSRLDQLVPLLIQTGEESLVCLIDAVTSNRVPLGAQRTQSLNLLLDTGSELVLSRLLAFSRWFDTNDRALALRLIELAPVDQSSSIAEDAANLFVLGRCLDWPELWIEQRQAFVKRLEDTPNLDGYSIGEFLALLAGTDVRDVIRLIEHRIDRSVDRGRDYIPIPSQWPERLSVRDSAHYSDILDELVEWIFAGTTWQRSMFGMQLFETVANYSDEEVLSLIERLVSSSDENRARLARDILNASPRNFVVEQFDFVSRLVNLVNAEAYPFTRLILAGLHGSAEFGIRSRSLGVDDPEELALRDAASSLAQGQREASAVAAFYREVAFRASRRIEEERADDRSLGDPRRW